MRTQTTHESFSREENVARSSERSFGSVIGAALGVLTVLNWWHDGKGWPWLAGAAVLFFAAGCFFSVVLQPPYLLWVYVCLLVSSLVYTPLIGLFFCSAVCAHRLVVRALGKYLLRLRREPECSSYWITRHPPGPEPETMKDQF